MVDFSTPKIMTVASLQVKYENPLPFLLECRYGRLNHTEPLRYQAYEFVQAAYQMIENDTLGPSLPVADWLKRWMAQYVS